MMLFASVAYVSRFPKYYILVQEARPVTFVPSAGSSRMQLQVHSLYMHRAKMHRQIYIVQV